MRERITKLNSVNDVCMFSVKCSIEIGPPNYNPPILGKKSKIANPPNITPTNISYHNVSLKDSVIKPELL